MSPSAVHALQRLLRLFRAEPRGVGDHHFGQPDDGIERRAQLVAHAGDELRLVLVRLCELATLVLDFVEQPHVLDRDRRLVREGRDQLDLLVGERLNGAARQDQHAGRSALAQHRHAEDCAHVGEPGSCSHPYLRICFGVHDMNGLALEYDPAGDRTAIRPERMLFHVLLLLRGKAVARDMMVGAVLGEPDGSPIRAAKACRRLGERVEHRRPTFDLQAERDTLTESAARLCRADRAAIRLAKDGAYHHVASYGFTPEQKEYMKEHALRPDRGSVTGRVVLQGKAVHVVDTKADAEIRLTVGSGFANVRTVLGVPMLREGTPTGVLILTRSTVEQ